ncbi:SusE outer membrane protein [bacterium A37T11]|nr:SusE outer membrane protein [bacterium A37T11]
MKRITYFFKTGLLLIYGLCLNACKYEIEDIAKIQEQLQLSASAADITLDEEHITDDILTFKWTEARPVSENHIISYTTKLDVVGNNFGSSTAIVNYEDEGIYSRSFSSEQLQNWANEKWKLPPNKSFTLEFRVVAQFEGGATFEAPEVRTVTINVQPIKTVIFGADKIFLDGTAIPGLTKVEISKTLENENQYAYLIDLQAGELQIPVEFNNETNYICPANNSGTLQDGEAEGVVMRENPISWKISTPGQYRIVVNMSKATVAIYSPNKALTPKVVQWVGDQSVAMTTEITELWMHGAINSWGTPIKMECTVSLADPQVLVYTGGKTGKTKFTVYGGNDNNKNLAYAFSCPLTATGTQQDQTLRLGKVADLSGGYSSAQRNSYYTIPTGTNIIVLDLRNMTILAEKR